MPELEILRLELMTNPFFHKMCLCASKWTGTWQGGKLKFESTETNIINLAFDQQKKSNDEEKRSY